MVTVHDDKRMKFGDEDHVVFREIQGMTELNDREPVGIETIDGFNFKIKIDTTNFGDYTREGIVESVKVPINVSYHSLKQSINHPAGSSQYGMLETPDLRCFGRSEQLHLAFLAIWKFQSDKGRLPENSEDDVNEVFRLA